MPLDEGRTEEGRSPGSILPGGKVCGLCWTPSHSCARPLAQACYRESPLCLSAGGSCPTAGDVVVVRGGAGWWGAGRKRRWLPARRARAAKLARTLAGIVLRLVGLEGSPPRAWSGLPEVVGWPRSRCEPGWGWALRRPGGEEPALWGHASNWASVGGLTAETPRAFAVVPAGEGGEESRAA